MVNHVAVITYLGSNPTKQQYKFGGKELITTNGLNEYDFGARNYYPAVPAFTRIDPMAEKYPFAPFTLSAPFARAPQQALRSADKRKALIVE